MKVKIFLLIFSAIFSIYIYVILIDNVKQLEVKQLLNTKLTAVEVAQKAILRTYLVVNKKYFFDLMKNKNVLDILHDFKDAKSVNEKNILRGKLFRTLYKEYKLLRQFGVNQFHFQTAEGKSLLRFHQPSKNGDLLTQVRNSVLIAKEQHKNSVGFETGRIYSGFRYVFPVIDKGEYLGSVEYSMTYDTIKKELNQAIKAQDSELILKKSASYDLVFKSFRSLLKKSLFDDKYYIEDTAILQGTTPSEDKKFIKNLIVQAKNSISFRENFKQSKDFSVPIIFKEKGYALLFLSIKNTLNQDQGYIVVFTSFNDILHINHSYHNFLIFGSIVISTIFMLLGIVLFQFHKLGNESKKLQKFIDIQNSIIILTDGKKFHYANKSFFNFFNYKTLDSFLKEHNCICELFLENDNFFSLRNVQENEMHWVESLNNLPERKRIVSMIDSTSIAHAFNISVGKYDEEHYVISFNDISDTMKEKMEIQEHMLHDQLTKAYNRMYFDKNMDKISNMHTAEAFQTGIIFFDIDFFKNVNDTYGHDIGDEILVNVVDIVSKNIRSSDHLIRWGGEEFLVITPVRSHEELYKIAQYLRKSIDEFSFRVVENLTCSFGFSVCKKDENPLLCVKRADEKLYLAKENGRNRVEPKIDTIDNKEN